MSFRIWITTALSVLQVNEIGQLASTAKQLETSTDILRKFSSPYRARLRVTYKLACCQKSLHRRVKVEGNSSMRSIAS